MKKNGIIRRSGTAAFLVFSLLLACPALRAQYAYPSVSPESAYAIPQSHLIQPEQLVRILQAPGREKPLMLQVGSHLLYAEAHIPGSEYVGPGSQSMGLQLLQFRVSSLPRNRFIVLYCGCCPWSHCPNVGPAFETLQRLGFTHVKVLYLPNNFGADWVSRGYPVAQGR
ncbi:MAG: rhodanese-like domain-containing protein [Terracidiphilus sp.]